MSIFEGTYAQCRDCTDTYPADLLNPETKQCRDCRVCDAEMMSEERMRAKEDERDDQIDERDAFALIEPE